MSELYVVKEKYSNGFYHYFSLVTRRNEWIDDATFVPKKLLKKLLKTAKIEYPYRDFEVCNAEEELKKVNEKYPIIVNDIYEVDNKCMSETEYKEYKEKNNLISFDSESIAVYGFDFNQCVIYRTEKGKKIRKGYNCNHEYEMLMDKNIYDSLVEMNEKYSLFMLENKCVNEYHVRPKGMSWGLFSNEPKCFKVLKEEKQRIEEEIKRPHTAYVIKDTTEPFYFKLDNGKLVGSKTKNWFEYIRTEFGILEDWMLEEAK